MPETMPERRPECPKCCSFNTQIEKQKKVYQRYICEKCGFKFTLEAKALAKRILRIRIILDLTQAGLAYHLDVSATRISAWENALTSLPMKKTMQKIVAMERHMEETGEVLIPKSKNRQAPRLVLTK